ncbi:MAG: ATP-binding protein [Magnetococcus sp. YQC-9]
MAKASSLKKLITLVCSVCAGLKERRANFSTPPQQPPVLPRVPHPDLMLHETAMRAAANTIVITDVSGRIQWVNPAFTRSTGYSFEEAVGCNPRILKSDHQDQAFYRHLWNTILCGQVWRGVFINKRKDGSLIHEESTITPVINPAGRITHFIAIKLDVTERVRIERELKEATIKAEAANQAKSDFLATMSHEIRTPLNVVLGILELLKDSHPDAASQEQIQLATTSGRSLLFLINDILDYSKIEADQLALESVPFNLAELLAQTTQAMMPLAQEKGITIKCFFPRIFPSAVMGDPNRIRQIFTNLIGNAIKFTPPDGHITCLGGPIARTEGRIEYLFEVRDTGIGVPVEEQQRIFERFAQANAATTRQFGGTGLGLAICRRLIRMMGGEIEVDDNPHAVSGASFIFTLALREQGTADLEPVTTSTLASSVTTPSPSIDNARILIVDDQSANLTVTLGMLTKIGCARSRCVTATSGLLALEHFQADSFDLVFMDCQMPLMDGYQTTRLIRQWEQQQERLPVPIVALTADVTQHNRQTGREAGMNDFLAKPVSLEELRQMLQKHLTTKETPEVPLVLPSTALPEVIEALVALGLDTEEIPGIAQLISEQFPELLDALEHELASGHHEQARATSHVLRGSMLHSVFPQMQQETRALHDAVRSKNWELARRQLQRVRMAFDPIQRELRSWLAGQQN